MPSERTSPDSTVPVDRQPAIRAFIRRLGGPEAFASRYALNPRTAQRIYAGKAACPAAVLAEILREADHG